MIPGNTKSCTMCWYSGISINKIDISAILKILVTYKIKLPKRIKTNVGLNFVAKATTKAINKIIILTALQPSTILATYLSFIICLNESSSGCCSIRESNPKALSTKLV